MAPADSPASTSRDGIAAVARRVLHHPDERGARVLHRGGVGMAGREAVVDVEHDVAAPRERDRHEPVRVLREDAEAAAVHVEDDGQGARSLRGPVDVEGVLLQAVVDVAQVVDALDAVALGLGLGEATRDVAEDGPGGVGGGLAGALPEGGGVGHGARMVAEDGPSRRPLGDGGGACQKLGSESETHRAPASRRLWS